MPELQSVPSTVNIYLCYYDTRVVNGKNQYYFRAVFLPSSLKGDVLLFLLNRIGQIDLSGYFDLGIVPAPAIISEGEQIYAFNGGTGGIFTAPCDLHKIMLVDYPAFNASFSTMKPNKAPWVIYTEIAPATLVRDDIPEPMNSLIPSSGNSFTPINADNFVLKTVVVAMSGWYLNNPASFTPALLWAYQGLVEQTFPENSNYEHITNPAAFDGSLEDWDWIVRSTGYFSGVFPGSEYAGDAAIISCETTETNDYLQVYFLHVPGNVWTWFGGFEYTWSKTVQPAHAMVRFYEPKADKPVLRFASDCGFLNMPDSFLPIDLFQFPIMNSSMMISPLKMAAPFQVFIVDGTPFEVGGSPFEVRE